MKWFYFVIAFLAGIASMSQAGVNAQLRQAISNPLFSAFASFSVGAVTAFILLIAFNKDPLPSLSTLSNISFWKWTGGILGVFIVFTAIIAGPIIGAANLITCIIAGQIFASILFDHWGIIGFPLHPINIYRILGVILLLLGVLLIQRN